MTVYGQGMNEPIAPSEPDNPLPSSSVEDVMRDELAYGDATLGTVGPILGHLVLNHDHSLFSDEIVARVRGMLASVARQLIDIETVQAGSIERKPGDVKGGGEGDAANSDLEIKAERLESLTNAIAADAGFLQHCHSLAIEYQLAAHLKARNSLDPVLSPLIQAMIADKDKSTASIAMATLAAQARFMQQQRRMVLPLAELRANLAQHAVQCWRSGSSVTDDDMLTKIMNAQRSASDETRSRLGLIRQLLDTMARTTSGGMAGSLSIPHAGLSIFISALGATGGITREDAALITNDRQMARLALTLRGAGLQAQAVQEQFHYLHPNIELPADFDTLRPDRARDMLGARS